MGDIIPFRSRKERKQRKEEKTRLFFRDQEQFFKEAFQNQKEKDWQEMEHFDSARQTGYDLNTRHIKAIRQRNKNSQKNVHESDRKSFNQ